MLAHHFVNVRLPALALLTVGFKHIRADTDRLVDLVSE